MLPHMALLSSSFLCCAVVTQSSVERAVPAEIGCIWIIRMPNSLFKPDLLDLKMKQDAVNYFKKKKCFQNNPATHGNLKGNSL